jgi:tRNA-splicing ligase RtcB
MNYGCQVLAAHGETIRVLHTLTPLGVAMAGANEFDPYKDWPQSSESPT